MGQLAGAQKVLANLARISESSPSKAVDVPNQFLPTCFAGPMCISQKWRDEWWNRELQIEKRKILIPEKVAQIEERIQSHLWARSGIYLPSVGYYS